MIRTILCCIILVVLPVTSISALEYILIQPAHLGSNPPALSADGTFIAMNAGPSGISGGRATVWSRAGATDLGVLTGDSGSDAIDISADGSVVAGTSYGSSAEAFIWTSPGGLTGLGTLPPYQYSYSQAVSDDGMTIVGSVSGFPSNNNYVVEAFRWTKQQGMVGLGVPAGMLESSARDVSADGRVIAIETWQRDAPTRLTNFRALVWTEANGFEELGPLPAGWESIRPKQLSSDGSVLLGIGGPGNGITRPYLWSRDTGIMPLPILNEVGNYGEVYPLSMTADAGIVIGDYRSGIPTVPFVWDAHHGTRALRQVLIEEHGLTQLPLSFSARAISADGRALTLNIRDGENLQNWFVYLDKPLVSTIAGDFNSDGKVDASDYVVWRKGVATSAYTQADYNTWRANFGAPAAGAAAGARTPLQSAVPEPGMLAFAALALAAFSLAPCTFHRAV